MNLSVRAFTSLVSIAVLCCATTGVAAPQLTVAAPTADRLAALGSFAPPPGTPAGAHLTDAAGQSYAIQIGADGQARFIIPQQRAGEALVFKIVAGPAPSDRVAVKRSDSELDVRVDGAPVIAYQTDREKLPRADIDVRYKRAAYLHPVRTPAGAIVTGDFPSNHVHHHGIWSSWSKVQFQGRPTNFWETVEQKGNTEFVRVEKSWSGPVHGGFVARQQMVDFTSGKTIPAVNETWEVTMLAGGEGAPAARVFDLVITQTAASADPVVFPKHLYGGSSFRGRDEWNGKENLLVLTSEGATTRDAANMSRVRWIYFGGTVGNGRTGGIAILSHPDNVAAPQPIRVHPDMPYFCFSPVQLGDIRLEPGKPYFARYRYVVMDGPPNPAQIEAYWNGYTRPPSVTIDPR
jgi:hypothetical protein